MSANEKKKNERKFISLLKINGFAMERNDVFYKKNYNINFLVSFARF